MMSMCPHVVDALRWVLPLQHRNTRLDAVCSHKTATNLAGWVQLPCLLARSRCLGVLQIVKMRKFKYILLFSLGKPC